MQIFYVDESGTGLKDHQTPYFLLCALGIRIEDTQVLGNKVNSLKRRLLPWAKPEDFEIKGRDLRRGDKAFSSEQWTWENRLNAIRDVRHLIGELPCTLFIIRVDKRELPEQIESDDQLYRLALWRLLDALNKFLQSERDDGGLMMLDMRSTFRFYELPWFGFSAFYAGLQMSDFVAYMTDLISNEQINSYHEIARAYDQFKHLVRVYNVP